MMRVRLARVAREDIKPILGHSETEVGPARRARYRTLLDQALTDLAENPSRTGVRPIADVRVGYVVYHLRWSTPGVIDPSVRQPRHLLAFSIDDVGAVTVAAVVHERELLERHLN